MLVLLHKFTSSLYNLFTIFLILSSRYPQQLPEMCHSYPSAQNISRESPANYQRQMSEPCLPYPQQGFKQEYHDPMYDQANHIAPNRAHRYPSSVVIKQEQTDYSYDSGKRPATVINVPT